jgi:hypothetical protein
MTCENFISRVDEHQSLPRLSDVDDGVSQARDQVKSRVKAEIDGLKPSIVFLTEFVIKVANVNSL